MDNQSDVCIAGKINSPEGWHTSKAQAPPILSYNSNLPHLNSQLSQLSSLHHKFGTNNIQPSLKWSQTRKTSRLWVTRTLTSLPSTRFAFWRLVFSLKLLITPPPQSRLRPCWTSLNNANCRWHRSIKVDATFKANSGHPGAPMGLAPAAHVLFNRFMKYNPKDPKWVNRDRFVLSWVIPSFSAYTNYFKEAWRAFVYHLKSIWLDMPTIRTKLRTLPARIRSLHKGSWNGF